MIAIKARSRSYVSPELEGAITAWLVWVGIYWRMEDIRVIYEEKLREP